MRFLKFFIIISVFIPASLVHAATFVSGTISSNTVWTASSSPYVVQGSLAVANGATLTIEPGTVVKLDMRNFYNSFGVGGVLNANGTADSPIYFTSLKDDSAGGDTNGDGSASSPQTGDWTAIHVFNTGSANFSNVVIRYGGASDGFNGCGCEMVNFGGNVLISGSRISNGTEYGIRQTGGLLQANGSEFSGNRTAIWIGAGAANISGNHIHNNIDAGILADTGALDLTDNVFVDNVLYAARINGAVNFTHSGNTANGGAKNGFAMSGALAGAQTWTADGMPYIINGAFSVPAGASLTIQKGVTVKFLYTAFYNYFTVSGALKAEGASDKKVYFTSLKDDSVGGDTNGDGSAASPANNDWQGITFLTGSIGALDNAVIRYAGASTGFNGCNCALVNIGGNVSLSGIKISDTDGNGIRQTAGSLNVTDSEITKNSTGIWVESGTINISQSSIHDNSQYGILNTGITFADAQNNWWGAASGPYHSLLNPNGLGNRVSNLVNFIPWLGSDPLNPPVKLDPVIIIPGILGSSDKNGVWVIDPIFHTYDDLIATLKANGYAEGKDLFTFPYDWRQSNVITAVQLRDKINEVQAICHCGKVDLVAHSMGGLVARQYIQSDKYENDVDQLIFLGTPHLGAPKSYLMWEAGENDIGGEDQFIKFILGKEAKKAGHDSLFDYIRNKPIPSVQELLPIYDYLRDKDSGNLRVYPTNPQNAFLENLKAGIASLFASGIGITNIVGEQTDNHTINTIRVVPSPLLPLWENGYSDGFYEKIGDRGLERGLGDGTVPKNSSEFIVSDLNELNSQHSELPTKAEGFVFKKLTGKDATILITGNSDSFLDINFKLLMIKILSPIDVVVTAPDGKRIGKDFSTNSEINEIDGAFYSGFQTDNEYITIPNPLDGEYKIQAQGTGSGSYTVATGYIADNVSVDKDFTAQTQPGLITGLNLEVNNANPAALEIKPVDATPPAIAILSPQNAADYLRSGTLPINISITDLESGVASSQIRFDGRIVNNADNIDLFFEKLGNHKLSVSATDFVGNATGTEVQFRVIATVDSTIFDIGRAFLLGWIDNAGVKNSLVKKLQSITKIEKKIEIIEERLPGKPKLQKRIEKLEKRIDKILGKAFLKELEAQRGKHINEQSYQLLIEDINWLLNN